MAEALFNKQSAYEVFMNDLAKHRRAKKNKQQEQDFVPKGILDIIETEYPHRYPIMSEDHTQIKALFSELEWLDILTKSRNSYKRLVKLKTRKTEIAEID